MVEAKTDRYFIIDFDSTFIQTESLEELARIMLKGKKNREAIITEIASITTAGMNGTIPFTESLRDRLSILRPHRAAIKLLATNLSKKITPSIRRNKEFFKNNADNIYIISGGFAELIKPVVAPFGIMESHVLANTFIFDKKGKYAGFDSKNPLSRSGGKALAVAALKLNKPIVIVGDGYTDYEIKSHSFNRQFVAFTENVRRQSIVDRADFIAPSFDEVLYRYGLKTTVSYPKNRIRVLLTENIHSAAVQAFEKEGYAVETVEASLESHELIRRLKGISLLGIRSRSHITEEIIKNCPHLLAIGAFCIGTDQVALRTAANKGIVLFNAPYSNSRSVVELVLGEIIMLARGVFPKSMQLHAGVWNKSAVGSFEIRGKTLGIIGYGTIGSQLGVLAENIGMNVIFYDIAEKLALGNAQQLFSLKELLKKADIVTLHIDGRRTNERFIAEREFGIMKKGSLFINASRGFVVDSKALAAAVKNGQIAAAAIDVFSQEPTSADMPFVSDLQGLHNIILTPHIGGSTNEAQESIARFVSAKLIDYINTGSTVMSVNMPHVAIAQSKNTHRFLHMHRNVPGMLSAINTVFANHSINIVNQVLKNSFYFIQ